MSCNRALVIHRDGSFFCTGSGCLDGGLVQAVLRHRLVVSCQTVLAGRCPACDTKVHQRRRGADMPTNPTYALPLCPGTAVVHVDGSVECSEPGCRAGASLGEWLAAHGSIQTCRSRPGSCTECSDAEDKADSSSRVEQTAGEQTNAEVADQLIGQSLAHLKGRHLRSGVLVIDALLHGPVAAAYNEATVRGDVDLSRAYVVQTTKFLGRYVDGAWDRLVERLVADQIRGGSFANAIVRELARLGVDK